MSSNTTEHAAAPALLPIIFLSSNLMSIPTSFLLTPIVVAEHEQVQVLEGRLNG